MGRIEVQPAILSRSLPDARRKIALAKRLTPGLLHIDIMDRDFVPNTTLRPQSLKTLRGLNASYHVMALHPERYLEDLRRAGAREIIVHAEATKKPAVIAAVLHRMGLRFGIAINPETGVAKFRHILRFADTVLVMSVRPGFSGQRFRPSALAKVRAIRRIAPRARIGVDGGINERTASMAALAGADFVCAASAVFAAKDPQEGYRALVRAVRSNGSHESKGRKGKTRDRV